MYSTINCTKNETIDFDRIDHAKLGGAIAVKIEALNPKVSKSPLFSEHLLSVP